MPSTEPTFAMPLLMANDFPPSVPFTGGSVDEPEDPPDDEVPDDPPDEDAPDDDPPDDDDGSPDDELDEDELLVVVDVHATTVTSAPIEARAKRDRESIGSE